MCVARSRAPSLYRARCFIAQASPEFREKTKVKPSGVGRAVLNSEHSGNVTNEGGAPDPRLEKLASVSAYASNALAGLLLAYARADVRQQSSDSQLSFCAASSPQCESRDERVHA